MSTRSSIAYVSNDDIHIHIYRDCLEEGFVFMEVRKGGVAVVAPMTESSWQELKKEITE